jgi:hypothetical protein
MPRATTLWLVGVNSLCGGTPSRPLRRVARGRTYGRRVTIRRGRGAERPGRTSPRQPAITSAPPARGIFSQERRAPQQCRPVRGGVAAGLPVKGRSTAAGSAWPFGRARNGATWQVSVPRDTILVLPMLLVPGEAVE